MTSTEWRAKGRAAAPEEVVDLPLPSGMTIRARRPGPMQFAAWQRLPLMLTAATAPGATPSDKDAMEIARLLRELLEYCCVSPRIVEEPKGENEIAAREVPEEDWQHIVGWGMRTKEAAAVRPFRPGAADGGSGEHGVVVQMPAERTDGDRG